MLKEFKEFLLKQNALALAIGVIIGAAVGKVVSSIADNVISPVIGLLLPGGSWRESGIVLSRTTDEKTGKVLENVIGYGPLIGAIVDFVIIGFVIFLIAKAFIPKPGEPKPTKECPQCREIIPVAATRCRACAQPLPQAG